MPQVSQSAMSHRKLLLFKWLMVFIPPVTVAIGHVLLVDRVGPRSHEDGPLGTLLAIVIVTLVALVLAYIFVESLFTVLRNLQAEAMARDQDILTMNAVIRERERMSRELHDGAAQLVAHLLLRLDTITELVADNRRQEAQAELERLHGIAGEIYEDIDGSIAGTRANMAERGLIGALRDYFDQFEDRHQITVQLQADRAADLLAPPATFHLFRLIQEALTNVRKHAGTKTATVSLTSNGRNQLSVVIADYGHGFALDDQQDGEPRTLGLKNMRERVEALDGVLFISSQPGAGTRITASIPMPESRRENTHATIAASPG